MLDSDDVGGICIVSINMQNWTFYDGGGIIASGHNSRVTIGLKLRVVPIIISRCAYSYSMGTSYPRLVDSIYPQTWG